MGFVNLEDVSFCYAERQTKSLVHINLQIEQGECVILAGLSGSGKSTLIRLLAGLIPSFFAGELTGNIDVADLDWNTQELWQKAKLAGTVMQNPGNQFFCAIVAQELVMAAENYGFPPQEINDRKLKAASLMDVEDLDERLLTTLSSGQQQRVAMASSLCLNPEILLLDEPSANLSPDGVKALAIAILEAKEAGKTIIIAEHRFRYLRDIANRLVVLGQGKIIKNGTLSLLRDEPQCRLMGLRYERLQTEVSLLKTESVNLNPNTQNNVLQIEDAGFRYRKKTPLVWNELSLSFDKGEIVALTGTNGCGKTTMLGCLFGLHKLSTGTLHKKITTQALTLQQAEYQLFASRVFDELNYNAEANITQDARDQWLSRFDLWQLGTEHPLTLSGGEAQRLVLAAAFVQGTELLLLDEPTSGMDGFHLQQLAGQIKKTADSGCLVIIATHDYELIEMCATRIIEMDKEKQQMKHYALKEQKCAK